MDTRSVVIGVFVSVAASCWLWTAPAAFPCHALPIHPGHRPRLLAFTPRTRPTRLPPSLATARSLHGVGRGRTNGEDVAAVDEVEDDAVLLAAVDPATLQNLCVQYSLSTAGTKEEMLQRLRDFAAREADKDRERLQGRKDRVEANLEGKARHTTLDPGGGRWEGEDDEEDNTQGYFYYAVAETEQDKEDRRLRERGQATLTTQAPSTLPPPPAEIRVNERGERVATVYSTTDKNDLTGMAASAPQADMSLENARYQQRVRTDAPEDSLLGGPFGDARGARRREADAGRGAKAEGDVRELVAHLLATTGAPAFQEGYEEGDGAGAFAAPFSGFEPARVPPDLLSRSSAALRANGGEVLREVLAEYELRAIGEDGMAADDRSEGGGHYREVGKVGSFLEGYRKAEERRLARETSTLLLDRLIKEGVKGLDELLLGMVREGDDASYMTGAEGAGAGELNSELVRYLEEAIREQERRVERMQVTDKESQKDLEQSSLDASDVNGGAELVWNVTRGDDGTIIETFDPNDPAVEKLLREELEKSHSDHMGGRERGDSAPLSTMTVQEKMLLLLTLLRDRVKVEAVLGQNPRARNLRLLAYCLKAGTDDERHQLVLDELGNSLDSLDIFLDLVTAALDFAEARSHDDFSPGERPQPGRMSSIPDATTLRKIRVTAERIKEQQSWKAANAGGI